MNLKHDSVDNIITAMKIEFKKGVELTNILNEKLKLNTDKHKLSDAEYKLMLSIKTMGGESGNHEDLYNIRIEILDLINDNSLNSHIDGLDSRWYDKINEYLKELKGDIEAVIGAYVVPIGNDNGHDYNIGATYKIETESWICINYNGHTGNHMSRNKSCIRAADNREIAMYIVQKYYNRFKNVISKERPEKKITDYLKEFAESSNKAQ